MVAPAASPREVDVAGIERELVRLLHAPENLSPAGVPAARTAVLNLVAYASDRATMERIGRTLAALVDHHPSRTIIAMVDDAATGRGIEAWVQLACKPLGTTGMRICAERVVLEAPAAAARRLPNAILALLVADLPVVLWWPGEPPMRDPLLHDFLEPAYRFVIDTTEGTHLERFMTTLSALRQRPGLAVDLSDLNWERIRPWREVIAQLWDVPVWRNHLRGIDRVEIDLARPPGGRSNRSQALLVVGWLIARLGWRPIGLERLRDGYTIKARRPGAPVDIQIRISSGTPPGLRGVAFHVETPRRTDSFAIRAREGDSCEVVILRDGVPVGPRRVSRMESYSEPELLARALDTLRGDTTYEDALETAVALLTSGSR